MRRCPWCPDDPERRAVTGGLSLSYAVVPDELAGQLEVRRQVWFVDYAGGTRSGQRPSCSS